MRVLLVPVAREQVDTIDDWWRENRPASPDLCLEELSSALDLLATAPNLGRRYPHATVKGVRRELMRSSHYHVYYIASEDAVIVLSVWSGQTGVGPDLSSPA